MNILFLSEFYPDALLPNIQRKSKIGLDWAAHNLNQAIIKGLHDNGEIPFLVNTPLVGSFPPFSNMIRVPSMESDSIVSVPYVNISYIKRFSIRKGVRSIIIEWCQRCVGDKYIIYYNFNNLSLVTELKQLFSDVKVVLIVTDLPEYMSTTSNLLTRLNELVSPSENLKKGEHFAMIDGYILLAEHMRERLPVGNTPWLLMEGIYNSECQLEPLPDKDSKRKIIMYTGNLGSRYGIRSLVEAFKLIESEEYRLWIRGDGELKDYVKQESSRDNRILYLDRMTRDELQRRQQAATLLVNPVPTSQLFTKYFFPSKTLEYLASGTPTLMSRLECMPKDYDGYYYTFDDESIPGMCRTMMSICELPKDQLALFGSRAAEFVLSQKTPKAQMTNVLSFLKSL